MEIVHPPEGFWNQIEELEYLLFDNGLNATSLEQEFKSGSRIWMAGRLRIEGYMLIRESHGMADILRLGVRPSCQRLGIGTSLLKEAKATFRTLMLSVRKTNVVALGLYSSFGFQIVGDLGESWVMVTSSASRSCDRSDRTA